MAAADDDRTATTDDRTATTPDRAVDGKKTTGWNRPWMLGVPVWGWVVGWLLGLAIAVPMFDNLIVAMIFALSIGTAFALAFKPGEGKSK